MIIQIQRNTTYTQEFYDATKFRLTSVETLVYTSTQGDEETIELNTLDDVYIITEGKRFLARQRTYPAVID